MESDAKPAAAPAAILWVAPGAATPPELLTALSRGGLGVERVSSPYLALAHLCRAETGRPRDARTAAAALVLVDPGILGNPGQVCEAVGKYAPHSRCWVYASGSNQRLRAVVQEDVDGWLKEAGGVNPGVALAGGANPGEPGRTVRLAPTSRTAAEGGPKLRLAGESERVEGGAERADLGDAGEQGQDPKTVLTSEELEMLLEDREPT